jgi:hypothetical protein
VNLFLYLVIAWWIFYRWRSQQPPRLLRHFEHLTVVDIVDSLLKGIPHFLELGPRYIVSSSLYFVGQAIAAITRNERYHQFFAIFYLFQTVIISFALFHTLM